MRIPQLDQWEAVRVTWDDSAGHEDGWHRIRRKERETRGIVTVGQVESITKAGNRLTLVLSWDGVTKSACGVLTIPGSAITNLERLG